MIRFVRRGHAARSALAQAGTKGYRARRRWWGELLVLLALLLSQAAPAQPGPAQRAQFQRRLRAMGMAGGHRFWDAPLDSLRRVLATQQVDSLRLQTLEHLYWLDATTEAEGQELATLAARLHYPEQAAFRLIATGRRLYAARTPQPQPLLDSLQAAQRQLDALGPVPTIANLILTRNAYNKCNQPAANLAYFQRKLAYYQRQGPAANVAVCYRSLGNYYERQGDYNQGISYRLRAAELYRSFSYDWYYNEFCVIGADYVEWGNSAAGLPYLRRSLAWSGLSDENWSFSHKSFAESYLRQHRYPLALSYLHRAQRRPAATGAGERTVSFGYHQPFLLTLESAALLGLGQPAEARQRLLRAQYLADSMRLPLRSSAGYCELKATWARYYAATGRYPQAEAAWLAAYRQACQEHVPPLRLAYLHALASFYQQRRQPALAAPYALAALVLADTLGASQAATHVARYALVQADRAQQARLASLRRQQVLDATQAQHQRRVLGYVSAGVVALLGLAGVLFTAFRRSQRLSRLVTAQKQDLQQQRDQLDASLTELRTTQAQLIQKEKMASLGELTAGIAHEIQNPLNFVNNFADVSQELLTELRQAQATGDTAEAVALADDLTGNLVKIAQHGRRASGIVRGMLAHSRQGSGERQLTNLNALCDEYLRLAYHGLRAQNPLFSATLETDFAPSLPQMAVVAGDLGRVLLNLFSNAFYAVQQRQQQGAPAYLPTVRVCTRQAGRQVEICIIDNGTGMSAQVQAKLFQPFFTTKPAGEGTGLGLSLSYDIVTQGHGGTLAVESQPGCGSTFTIRLPARPNST